MSSSDSEAPEADPAGGSEDDGAQGVMAVTAVTAAATSDRMESDSDSDKSSENSGLKRKASALKVGMGGAGQAHLTCVGCSWPVGRRQPMTPQLFLLPPRGGISQSTLPP